MPFKPGQSGNPSGSKAKQPWTDALRRALLQFEDPEKKIPAGEALRHIADDVVRKAVDGDNVARDELWNRLEGRPAQTIQGPDGDSVFGPLVGAAEGLRKKLR